MNAWPTIPNFDQTKREVVLLGGINEFHVINAHTPTGYRFSRDKLISFILKK